MCELGTITYRKHSAEADLMGRRREEETLVSNRQETLRASSHPASLYVQGNFAIAFGHVAICPLFPICHAFGRPWGFWFPVGVIVESVTQRV